MVLATNLGFPRVGADRELKKATESYWKNKLSHADLLGAARELRLRHWQLQKNAGIAHIPSNDFSFYDQVLDTSCLLGCVPERFGWNGRDAIGLETYFSMARGSKEAPAMEMTKWFDTNYHYIVPEFEKGQTLKLSSTKIFDEFLEAKEAGILTRPVLISPITFIRLGKAKHDDYDPKEIWDAILPIYEETLRKLQALGAEWVQIDEPSLALDLDDEGGVYAPTYERLANAAPGLKLLLATYFDGLRNNLDLTLSLPVQAVHLDLCRAPEQLDTALANLPADKILSLGVVDGRNIWKNDLSGSLALIEKAVEKLGPDRVMVAPSCSLLHTPFDLNNETKLEPQVKSWLSFATQKLDEIAALAKGRAAMGAMLSESDRVAADRKSSGRIHNKAVQERLRNVTATMLERGKPFAERQKLQHAALNLPAWPTTTIGSFPQTQEIRAARASYKKGALSEADYDTAMKKEIAHVVAWQEAAGMDVPVHGEAERNDMVEYFGEQMDGFAFTANGWVQSYGTRCVKPPIIYGDVSRPMPMTVHWSQYAQSLTRRPMKGMLTGPITILCWSFVRDDQPREMTCKQIALAIRDEVSDLEKAGIHIIQIDEPAIREGLPLRREDWAAYLKWAVDSFRLASSSVADATQIHTHMCYAEFNDIIDSVAALDADVISIETSRSQMELLEAFVAFEYPNEIGPGVYDIHSPRVPTVEEMTALLGKAAQVIDPRQLWVNPDCGLKTRGWPETEAALKNMIAAARVMREKNKDTAA